MDINVLKALSNFIDWVKDGGISILNHIERRKLNKVINAITDLVKNKKEYLERISLSIDAEDNESTDLEIRKALNTAKRDTELLKSTIEGADLKDSEVYRILQLKADLLANSKLLEISRLEELVGFQLSGEGIAEKLAKYEKQWSEIGQELEAIKHRLADN